MKKLSSFLLLAGAACLIATTLHAADTPVSGIFKSNGKDAKLAFASARKGDPFMEKDTVVVTLTEKDPGADKKPDIKAGFGDYGSALVLTFLKNGDVIGCDVAHQGNKDRTFSSIGRINASDFKSDDKSIHAKLSTNGPVTTFDDTWQVDLTFNAKIQ